MTALYQNFNLWDRLKVCVVGRNWQPDFYRNIPDAQVRASLEKIAQETEEDYQQLAQCLERLNVEVLRPELPDLAFDPNSPMPVPPMAPRNHMGMFGHTLVETFNYIGTQQGNHGPDTTGYRPAYYNKIFEQVRQQGNTVVSSTTPTLCGAMIYQLDNHTFYSQWDYQDSSETKHNVGEYCAKQPVRFYQPGHIDGWFCPVTPGLIISSTEEHRPELLDLFFKKYFAGWEVVYLDPSYHRNNSFRNWCDKHNDSWWLPGQENNQQLTTFIDRYLNHWLGLVSETVFEVNMLVVDSKNVIVSRYNENIFKKFEHYGVTAHVCNLRHESFWDTGVNCATCDLSRI